MPPTTEQVANSDREHRGEHGRGGHAHRRGRGGAQQGQDQQRADDLDRERDRATEQHHEHRAESAQGTPRAAATSGSTLANIRGRQIANRRRAARRAATISEVSCGVVDRDDLPGEQPELVGRAALVEGEEQDAQAEPERHQHADDRVAVPGPVARAGPMTAPRSASRRSIRATTLTPSSSAADAPAKDSSLMPCTANGRSRAITKTPIRPPSSPSTAPAIRGVADQRQQLAVVGEVEDVAATRRRLGHGAHIASRLACVVHEGDASRASGRADDDRPVAAPG